MPVLTKGDLVSALRSVTKTGPTGKGKSKPNRLVTLVKEVDSTKGAYEQSVRDYMSCVLRPDLYTAKIPSIFPVPSHLCQTKGTSYLTTNATGNLVVALVPHLVANILVYNNNVALTEASSWTAGSITTTTPASINNYHAQFRVVGAWLKCEYLEPSNTRKGIIAAGFLHYNAFSGAGILPSGFTNDALRDQPGVATLNASTNPKAWARYVPLDPSYLSFASGSVSGSYPCCAWSLSGGAPSSVVAVTYRVVYEIIPLPQYTDLLVPTLGPAGDSSKAITSMASQPTSGSGSSPSLGEKIGTAIRDAGKKISDNAQDLVMGLVSDKIKTYTEVIVPPAKGGTVTVRRR